MVKLGDGVYSCIHRLGGKAICNVGIVDNGEETIIFDSFLSPKVAEELLGMLDEMDLSPVKYVINSHAHNDHIRGNQVFSEQIKIISTRRTKEIIEEQEPLDIESEKEYAPARLSMYDSLYRSFDGDQTSREYEKILMWRPYYQILSTSHLDIKTRLPNTFVDSILTLDGSRHRVQLIARGPGHTESDLVLYLPDDEILFAGDLIFNDCHPYVAHGSIKAWKNWLDFLNELDLKTIMPGHGALGNKELIDQMKNYLLDLEAAAADLHLKKQSVEIAIHIPDAYADWWFDRFYAINLRFAFENAAKEDKK